MVTKIFFSSLLHIGTELAEGAGLKGSFWFPPQASTNAHVIDGLFDFVLWLSVFFFILITVLMVWFGWRYRSSRVGTAIEESPNHHTGLELTWTILPSLMLFGLFLLGAWAYIDTRVAPRDSLEIMVTARKWNWEFKYPNGATVPELHVPLGQPVRLVMRSEDVLHSLFVPAFRVKMDVVPGRYTTAWFEAKEMGSFPLFCTEYCGTSHSKMLATVVVSDPSVFKNWLAEAGDVLKNKSPVEVGEYVYKAKGCMQCHSVDGVRGIGPSFKGVYGTSRTFADGTTGTVDENYIRESIVEPRAKVAQGFPPVMPTFQGKLKDQELDGLIAYIKSLSQE